MPSQDSPVRRMVFVALLSSGALVLSFVDSMILLPVPVPGVRLGLSNAFVLLALYLYGPFSGAFVVLVKVLLSCLLFQGFGALPYALAGGILSFSLMALVYRFSQLTPMGVSVLGGASHVLAQVAVGALVTKTPLLFIYATPLMWIGSLTGFLLGVLIHLALPRIRKAVKI